MTRLSLRFDSVYGIISLEKQKELLKLKKQGENVDIIDWRPQIKNYIFCKVQARDNLKDRLSTCETELKESLRIFQELSANE